MSIRIYGATSGYVDLDAPAVAGSASVTLPGSGTLATQAYADGLAGLTLITTQTFSAASSVSVNNCFSSTYDHYRLEVSIVADSFRQVSLRLRASAADNTTSNYYQASPGVQHNGTSANITQTGGTAFSMSYVNTGFSRFSMGLDVFNPQAALATQASGVLIAVDSSSNLYQGNAIALSFNAATQFDGFSLYPAAGTITGTVRVYGYRN